MSILLVAGNKLSDVKNSVIKSIKTNGFDLSCENIIVVPDRYSLIVEKSVFENLNIKSTFLVKVMGINSIARQLIENANLGCVFVNPMESDFVLYRAIQNVKSNFVCFTKNISTGMFEKVKNALSLLRSSSVSCSDLRNNAQNMEENVQKKLLDLAMILEEYERLLDSRLDATNVLKLFSSLIEQSNIYKNTNFYFCGFDSFTKQGYEIVKKLAKICNCMTVGVIVPSNNKNSNIYDDEMLKTLTSYFKQENLEYSVEYVKNTLSEGQKQVFENVYAYNIKQKNIDNFYNVFELPSKEDEALIVAKFVQSLAKNGHKFSEMQIATSESYYPLIEKTFFKYGINFYIDKNKKLSETPLKYFLDFALSLCMQLDKENLINFVNNYFVDIDKGTKNDVENFILENNIEYKKTEQLYNFNLFELSYIIDFTKQIKTQENVRYYISKIQELLENYKITEKIDILCEKFRQNGDLKNEKTYLQILDKITELNDKFVEILGDEQITLYDFYDLYFNTFNSLEISDVPLNLDCVFVGDASKSFFEKTNYMFVVGASQDMPTQIKDLGLISDQEIDNLKTLSISPTAKIINKRNKYKLFDILTESKKLFVTYPIQDDEGKKVLPSNFVCDLLTLNGNKKITKEHFLYDISDESNFEKLKFNNPTKEVAFDNVGQNKFGAMVKKALYEMGEKVYYLPIDRENVENGKLMLKDNITKVSQIESYYSCPFKHFLTYGLKLKERKDGQIKANDFGNFLHEFCKIFVDKTKNNLGTLTQEQIDFYANKTFDTLLKKPNYKIICDEENNLIEQILKNEVTRFANFLNYEQSCSKFKIFETEYKFENSNAIKVEVDSENYSIIGIVDRIDKYNDNFRIIDYKTGSSQIANAVLSNLYFGTKIQVYVYLKAVTSIFNGQPFGAFYLPISNAFSGEDYDDYKLHGYFLDDINLVMASDSNLCYSSPKSKLFEATLSTDAKLMEKGIKKLSRSKNLTQEELLSMMNSAIKTVENGIKEITKGNTCVSPIKDACKFCEFSSICGIDGENKIRKKDEQVTPETFLGDDSDGT